MGLDRTPQVQNTYNPTYSGMQKVDFTATSAASSAVLGCNEALFVATTACYIVFAASPTATSAGFYIPANTFIALVVDGSLKVAAIRATADGSLYVTPLN